MRQRGTYRWQRFSTQAEETDMTRLMALLTLILFAGLTGCNTMEGVGKDIERGGEKLQGTAQDTKQKM
jgi:entericidin B